MSTAIRDLLSRPIVAAERVTVQGWIRTCRFAKSVTFIHLYDGSSEKTIQAVVSPAVGPAMRARLSTGAAVRLVGDLVPSPGPEQPSEVKCTEADVEIVGDCDATTFPVQKKDASAEFFRTIPHLRVRAAEYQRIFLARHTLSMAIHDHLRSCGFVWVHTPLITSSDCEGAGEVFHVATEKKAQVPPGSGETHWWLDGEDFFGKPAYLTVSGQLEVEPFALALGKVYTFGPTFRAEPSNTARHASEFWMIEPEMAFASARDVMDVAEGLIRACTALVAPTKLPPGPFARVTYTWVQEQLAASGRQFEHAIGWGESLQTEHERYIAEEVIKGPVFITDYPVTLKPFYMRVSDDGKTVACFDLIVPGVGEIIGGSAREERLDKLLAQMDRCGVSPPAYDWYLDLRRYGSVPHGGFGLGLERLLMWLLDVSNIRDAIPYPRTPGQLG